MGHAGYLTTNDYFSYGLSSTLYVASEEVCDSDTNPNTNRNFGQVILRDTHSHTASAGFQRGYGQSTRIYVDGTDAAGAYHIKFGATVSNGTALGVLIEPVTNNGTTQTVFPSVEGVGPPLEWSYSLPTLVLADTWQDNFWAEADYLTSDVPGTAAAASHTRFRTISYFDDPYNTTSSVIFPCVLSGLRDNVKWSFGSISCSDVDAWTNSE